MVEGSLVKKRIEFKYSKVSLGLDVNASLFSSHDVDAGTRALLNTLRRNEDLDYSYILDLGCGYGPVGLFLKAQDPSRTVDMVDRDALALAFSVHNAEVNRLRTNVYGSLDYETVQGDYSLIVTNFPAKAGEKGLRTFIYGASHHLKPEGVLAIIAVKEHAGNLKRIIRHRSVEIVYSEERKGYSIFHLSYRNPIPFPEDKYERREMKLKLSKEYAVRTALGLSEFDSLGYGTRAMIRLLRKMESSDRVYVLEPGQGHTAMAVMDRLNPDELIISSRDLLSLRFTARNLKEHFQNKPRFKHISHLTETIDTDLTVWRIMRADDRALNEINLKYILQGDSHLLVCGKTSQLKGLLDRKPVYIQGQLNVKNYSALHLVPRS